VSSFRFVPVLIDLALNTLPEKSYQNPQTGPIDWEKKRKEKYGEV